MKISATICLIAFIFNCSRARILTNTPKKLTSNLPMTSMPVTIKSDNILTTLPKLSPMKIKKIEILPITNLRTSQIVPKKIELDVKLPNNLTSETKLPVLTKSPVKQIVKITELKKSPVKLITLKTPVKVISEIKTIPINNTVKVSPIKITPDNNRTVNNDNESEMSSHSSYLTQNDSVPNQRGGNVSLSKDLENSLKTGDSNMIEETIIPTNSQILDEDHDTSLNGEENSVDMLNESHIHLEGEEHEESTKIMTMVVSALTFIVYMI